MFTIMNRSFLLTGLALFLGGVIFPAPFSPREDVYPEQFHVRGNQIVDSRQQEIVFRGVAAVDPLQQIVNAAEDEAAWNANYYKAIAEWGTTLVRIPIHPQYWRANTLEENLEVLDQTLAWIAENKMYAILDFHSIGYPPAEDFESAYDGVYLTSTEEWRQFWKEVAVHYRNNKTVVFYELFNEPVFAGYSFDTHFVYPVQSEWLSWRDCVEGMIKEIRQLDASKIIIVNGLSWSYDLSFALKDPIRADNIVYATHPYPNSDWHTNWDEAFGKLKDKYPVMATELGFEISGDKAEAKYKGPHRYRDDIIRYLEDKKISWVAWSFSNKWSPALLVNKDGLPSEAGTFFRSWLRR